MTRKCRMFALVATQCAALGAGACGGSAREPALPENRMADGSRCITLRVGLTCLKSTVEGQCTVTVHNRSGETALVHRDFAVGDEHEASKWRNLYFRVVDIKGYAYRMNARFRPTFELGTDLRALESLHGTMSTYDVALLHHRVSSTGRPIPLPFGQYSIRAYYDVSQVIAPHSQVFCKDVFESNRVSVEILGPRGIMSPGNKPNTYDNSPRGANPAGGTPFDRD